MHGPIYVGDVQIQEAALMHFSAAFLPRLTIPFHQEANAYSYFESSS
jgi:hypothetical protein